MEPEARRRACEEFRAKLCRDTGTDLTAAACEELLGATLECQGGEQVSLQSNPGRFYSRLGEMISMTIVPDPARETTVTARTALFLNPKVAWWCYREAAEVHKHPGGMANLASCYYTGAGVEANPPEAVAWYHKAVGLGDPAAQATLGTFYLTGFAPGGVVKDAARAVELLDQAAEQGEFGALFPLADCYLTGEGVEKDAVHGVALLRQVIEKEDESTALAQATLASCYHHGDGVEADTVQAAAWCQQAATGGDAQAIEMLPIILQCFFCSATPARQLCNRCRKVRYCDRQCQLGHWNHETEPHKGHCHRAAEASQQEAGGASTSAQ